MDLSDPEVRASVVRTLIETDPDRRIAYTGLILSIASETDRKALEELMFTATRRDNLADRLVADGRVQGQAAMLIRILQARGFTLTAGIRERITSCADTAQLEAWAISAVTAETLDKVFTS
jgi:hypothetical protein